MKDYYSILELPPTASLDEIKKAYRKLAHQYHPDKKGNDPYAVSQFAEIKEAYETLSNPLKKGYYLQQRWYAQSTGQKTTQQIITPVNILKQLLQLDKYVSTLDKHRMDEQGLYEYICHVLSDENIQKINTFNEPDVNEEIIYAAFKSSHALSYRFIAGIGERLKNLCTETSPVSEKIDQYISYSHKIYQWEKRRVWLIILAVLLLCTCIYLLGK